MNIDDLESRIKELIVEALQLEGVKPADITSEGRLFGEGLGLDSIDALELASAMETKFGVKFSRSANMEAIFASVHTLAVYVSEQRGAMGSKSEQAGSTTPR